MATISKTDWSELNKATVGTLSDGSSFTGLKKVQPVRVRWNVNSPSLGKGDAEFSSSVSVSDRTDFVVTESDESTTKPYQIPFFDTSNNEAWFWVYGEWDSDGSEQIIILAGGGDGTNYAWNGPHSSSGTGNNPWSQTGVNALGIYHLGDIGDGTADDSSGNNNDGTVNGASSVTGTFGSAADFNDANTDNIDLPSLGTDGTGPFTMVSWDNPDDTGFANIVGTRDTFVFWNGAGGSGEVSLRLYDGSGHEIFGSSTTTGAWRNLIGLYDGSTMEFFEDGDSQGTDSAGTNTDPDSWAVGGEIVDGDKYLDGQVDMVKIFDEVKGSKWAQAEYDASPKGGQTFFNWSGPETTSTEVTATPTLGTGTPLTAQTTSILGNWRAFDDARITERSQTKVEGEHAQK